MTWYQKNRAAVLARRKARYAALSVTEKLKLFAEQNRRRNDKTRAREARWRASRRGIIRKQHRAWYRQKFPLELRTQQREERRICRLLIRRLRQRIRKAILAARPRTIALLGCSAVVYRKYLESRFLPGMSWANRHLWHIDHEYPISRFDLTTLAGQQAAFHYTNTQPLWAVDNLRKGAKLPASAHARSCSTH